jgi:RNA polymerase sigma factor (sigma-70 family)
MYRFNTSAFRSKYRIKCSKKLYAEIAKLIRCCTKHIQTRCIPWPMYGICGSQQCAGDVLHNTYIKRLKNLPSFEGRAPLGMWLRQIAVNESLMYLRKHKKHKAVVSSDQYDYFEDYQDSDYDDAYPASSVDFTHQLDNQNDMHCLLNKLPEGMRLVLRLKEVEGYTHNEIATLVNKTPSYSKSVVSRALQFLRERTTLNDDLSYSVGEH